MEKGEKVKKYIYLIIYRYIAQYLPSSGASPFSKKVRYYCCKRIFKSIGKNVNIERKAFFGKGFDVRIGDNSGIGINCVVPSDVIIGENVLMGPNVYIFGGTTHAFERKDISIREQGRARCKPVIIENDIWIGRQSVINHGRRVANGTIIAAKSVVTRDFPEYSIIGGNPACLIKMR